MKRLFQTAEKPATTLDVREDIRAGREPFTKIMDAVARLSAAENLLLVAPFEPIPLFRVLGERGFRHGARKVAEGHWEVLFEHEEPGAPTARGKADAPSSPIKIPAAKTATVVELDARGLEPPQPLVTILEALSSLADNAELRARTDRRPLHLYDCLKERGFTGQTEEAENGSYITYIRRG